MKTMITLTKIRLSQLLSSMLGINGKKDISAKKNSVGKKILMAVLWTYVIIVFFAIFFVMFVGMAPSYNSLGLDWLYFTMYGIISFALMFIGSVFVTETQLFEAKDNELLLSMPIKPSYILMSRIAVIYLLNIFYEALVAVPALVAYAISVKMTFGAVLSFLILFLTLPLFSLSITCAIAFIIAKITAKSKNKTIFKMILSIGALAVYMLCYSKIGDYISLVVENGEYIAEKLGGAFPIYAFGASVGNGKLVYALLIAVSFAAIFSVVYALLSRGFISTVTKNRGAEKAKYVRKKAKNRGASSALVRRELMRFFSSATYMMNCGIGILIEPVIAAVLILKKADAMVLLTELGVSDNVVYALLALALSFVHVTVLISAPSVSLEGGEVWISRSLPVSGGDILVSKAHAHMMLAMPVTALSSLAVAVWYKLNVLGFAVVLLMPCVFCAFNAVLGTFIGVKFAKFNYTDETVAIKQSASVAIMMGISFGALVIPSVLYILLLAKYISPLLASAIFTICIAFVSLLVYNKLKKRGDVYFSTAGN